MGLHLKYSAKKSFFPLFNFIFHPIYLPFDFLWHRFPPVGSLAGVRNHLTNSIASAKKKMGPEPPPNKILNGTSRGHPEQDRMNKISSAQLVLEDCRAKSLNRFRNIQRLYLLVFHCPWTALGWMGQSAHVFFETADSHGKPRMIQTPRRDTNPCRGPGAGLDSNPENPVGGG